ncbi:MAB_1171c family putative transporter [Streptomyces sp. NPDC001795]|uniref:MAB_1171c family putative transporter n=1 Tax=Streptomyces sp. NPDC001795 TaxID=3154525 RepID=UPI00331697CB
MNHQVIVATTLWAVALWRAPSLRHSRKQRAISLAFLSLAAAMTLEVPAVSARIDSLTGVGSTGYLLKHMLGLVSAAAVLEFVIAVVRPRGFLQRSRRALEAACLVLMATAFGLAPDDARVPDDIIVAHDFSGWALLHVAVFTLYIGSAMTVTAILFVHAARHANDRWIRAGHSLLGLGGSIGILYALQRLVHLAHVAVGDATAADVHRAETVSTVLKVAAIAAITTGSCLSPISIAATTLRQRRALPQLDPLWHGLTDAVPSVVLPISPGQAHTRLLLHRRLVEISDATLALREYVPADLQHRAFDMAKEAGYPPRARSAVAEAAWLKTAALIAPASSPYKGEHPRSGSDGLSPAAELRWTCQVSAAYDRSPSVAAFARAEAARIQEQNRKQPA